MPTRSGTRSGGRRAVIQQRCRDSARAPVVAAPLTALGGSARYLPAPAAGSWASRWPDGLARVPGDAGRVHPLLICDNNQSRKMQNSIPAERPIMSESGGYRCGTCTLLLTPLIESFTASAGAASCKAEGCRSAAQISMHLPKCYSLIKKQMLVKLLLAEKMLLVNRRQKRKDFATEGGGKRFP